MGLSDDRATAQKKIETLQVLIDIGTFIKELPNSKDFAELSQIAYSLPEADQAKANAGRATIAEIDAKLAEQKQNAKDLQDEQDNIDLRTKQLNDANDTVIADRKKVSDRENAVSKREDAVSDRESKVTDRENKVIDRENQLSASLTALKTAQDDFANKQAEAKERADKIKQLSEGM